MPPNHGRETVIAGPVDSTFYRRFCDQLTDPHRDRPAQGGDVMREGAPELDEAAIRPSRKSLTRPRGNRWIAGVCSGLADRFGLPPTLVRLLFVLSCLLPGPQILIYVILWIIMPSE
jgi:phage shock protein C